MLAPQRKTVEYGRRVAVSVGAVLVGLELLVVIAWLTRMGTDGVARPLVRTVLTMILAVALYRGYQWARWGLVVLIFTGFFLGNFSLTDQPLSEQIPVLGMLAVYILAGRTLLYSRALATFMRIQRGELALGPPRG